jgi:hypothetical protein
MYKIVFAQKDNEMVLAEFSTLEEAKRAEVEYKKNPEYHNGIITVEKDKRIY